MPAEANHFEIGIEDGVASLPPDEWNAVVSEGSPFLEWAFLASLEEAGTLGETSGWSSKPLVARENGRIVAACPLYLKTNSEGEFVFDFSWADAAYRAGIEAARHAEDDGMSIMANSPENREAIAAFLQKRAPDFRQFRKRDA